MLQSRYVSLTAVLECLGIGAGIFIQPGLMDGQKAQLGTEKHGGAMMILITVLVKNVQHAKSGNRKTQIKKSSSK